MQTIKIYLVILICTTLLGACGLKGPLYLPNENPSSVPVPGLDSSAELVPEDNEKKTEDSGEKNTFYN